MTTPWPKLRDTRTDPPKQSDIPFLYWSQVLQKWHLAEHPCEMAAIARKNAANFPWWAPLELPSPPPPPSPLPPEPWKVAYSAWVVASPPGQVLNTETFHAGWLAALEWKEKQ